MQYTFIAVLLMQICMFYVKTELTKADRTVGVTLIYYPIFRQARPDFFRVCLIFAFAEQILPGSGTFDLSVGAAHFLKQSLNCLRSLAIFL